MVTLNGRVYFCCKKLTVNSCVLLNKCFKGYWIPLPYSASCPPLPVQSLTTCHFYFGSSQTFCYFFILCVDWHKSALAWHLVWHGGVPLYTWMLPLLLILPIHWGVGAEVEMHLIHTLSLYYARYTLCLACNGLQFEKWKWLNFFNFWSLK